MDYQSINIIKPKFWYSRLDHSIACALITWEMTSDKAQTLAALFHDLGTPTFSHAVDYMLGDAKSQTSSERKIEDVIGHSDAIIKYLREDEVELKKVVNAKDYPVVDNEIPRLCVDRLEGILSTGLIWGKFWNLRNIQRVYDMVFLGEYPTTFIQETTITLNTGVDPEIIRKLSEFFEHVPCFTQTNTGNFGTELALADIDPEAFFKGVVRYSMLLQTKESKFAMQFLGDILKKVVQEGIICKDDFYHLPEKEVIDKIENSKLKNLWYEFTNLSRVHYLSEKDGDTYCVQALAKKRFCDPLVLLPYGYERLSDISGEALDDTSKFLKLMYKENGKYITTDISKDSVKLLKQH
jgi:hypothetical protein